MVQKPPKNPPKPPESTGKEGRRLWNDVFSQWDLTCAEVALLREAVTCIDRIREAQQVITTEGLVVFDRFKQPKQHPATLVERDNKALLGRLLKQLNLRPPEDMQ